MKKLIKKAEFFIEINYLQQKISELPEGINTRGSDGIKLSEVKNKE